MSSDGFLSDFDNEDILDNTLDIDEFYFYYSDDILDIYHEFKKRFSSSPFFFSHLTYPILTELVFKIVMGNGIYLDIPKPSLDVFKEFYNVEIEYSYNTLTSFLRKFKKSLSYNSFVQFCFLYTDLHELKNA